MLRLYNDVIIAAELCSHPVNDAIIMNVHLKRTGKKLVVYLEKKKTGHWLERLRCTVVNACHLSRTCGI
jgi:hypothetical protein